MEKPRIVILDGYVANSGDLSWREIASQGELTVYDRTSPDEVIARCSGATAVFTNKVIIDADTIAALPDLKFIGVLATGYNNVDIEAARRTGIVVSNVPAYSTMSVAQLVFAMLLTICNRVSDYSASVAAGRWASCDDFSYRLGPIEELDGKTMAVYGLGNIGRRVAAIADAFGMHVVSCTSQPAENLPPYIEKVSRDEMFRRADVLSLNAPLTATNRHFVNAATIALMKPTAIVINTARGPLVDEEALADALFQAQRSDARLVRRHGLADALASGRLAFAAVDVLAVEPPRQGSPLIGLDNCIVTPHVAWQSTDARRRLLDVSAANLRAFLAGAPQNVVN